MHVTHLHASPLLGTTLSTVVRTGFDLISIPLLRLVRRRSFAQVSFLAPALVVLRPLRRLTTGSFVRWLAGAVSRPRGTDGKPRNGTQYRAVERPHRKGSGGSVSTTGEGNANLQQGPPSVFVGRCVAQPEKRTAAVEAVP